MRMSRGGLRLTLFTVLGALFVVAVGVQALAVHFVLGDRFAELQNRAARTEVHGALVALHGALGNLRRLDSSLLGRVRGAAGGTLGRLFSGPRALRNLGLDGALLITAGGTVRDAAGSLGHTGGALRSDLVAYLGRHPELRPAGPGQAHAGIALLHGTPNLVAVGAMRGDGTLLILVRALGSDRLAGLAPAPDVRLRVLPRPAASASEPRPRREEHGRAVVEAPLSSLIGGQGLSLQASMPARILAQGDTALWWLALLGALCVLAMLVGALLLLHRLVLSRLARLSRQLEHVGPGAEPSVSDLGPPGDELGRLSTSINTALSQLRAAKEALRESEQHFRTLAESIDGAIILHRGTILYCNPAACAITGYSEEQMVGLAVTDLVVAGQRKQEKRRLEARLHGRMRDDRRHELQIVTRDGQVRWLDVSGALISYRGRPAILNACFDITGHKRIEMNLQREKERVQVTLESIGDGVVATDLHGRIEFLNAVAEELTGWPAPEARGRFLGDVLALIDENTRQPLENPATECLNRGCRLVLAGHAVLVPRGGEKEHSIEVTASPVRGHDHEMVGVVLALHDVTELRGLARRLAYQANHDALTDLENRREFESRLEDLVASARLAGTHHALCYVDLDQFKVVNDTCGHIAGDALLRQLSAVVRGSVRESDTLARLGGDEFGLLFRDCDPATASVLAQKLRDVIRDFRFVWEGMVFDVGCSIGVVLISPDSPDHSELLSLADSACYLAKEHGRNRIHIHRPNDVALLRQQGEMRWMQRIQRAVEENRFSLYVQRIAPLGAHEPLPGPSQEVLLRMIDEDGRMVLPSQFLTAAERYRLMPAIDRWVVHEVARAMQREARAGRARTTYSVNLSGQSLSEDGFLQHVTGVIDAYGVDPECLCFELTETAVITNLAMGRRFISVLRGRGCRFALDDFGSGLSSFAYLKNLPMDFLKIDGQFVRAMFTGRLDRAVVEAINDLGRVVNMRTIAEFVETEQLYHAVRRMGVDYAQGNYIEMPHPLRIPEQPALRGLS